MVGLSPDFLLYSLLGFSCYAAYTGSLYFNHDIQGAYAAAHAGAQRCVAARSLVHVNGSCRRPCQSVLVSQCLWMVPGSAYPCAAWSLLQLGWLAADGHSSEAMLAHPSNQ